MTVIQIWALTQHKVLGLSIVWRVIPKVQLMCKGPSFPAKMRKNGTSECELDPSFCSRVETFLWEILELYKGLKESLEIPDIRCD